MPAPVPAGVYTLASSPVRGSSASISVTVASADVLLIFGATDYYTATLSTPTGGGLTYSPVTSKTTTSAGHNNAYAWTAKATSGQTFTLTVGCSVSNENWSVTVLRFSSCNGLGAHSSGTGSGAPSLALTTTAASSFVAMLSTDYNGTTGARTYLTSAGTVTEDSYDIASPYISDTVAHWATSTAGTQTVGMSAPTGQTWTAIAVEVLGSPVDSSAVTAAGVGSASVTGYSGATDTSTVTAAGVGSATVAGASGPSPIAVGIGSASVAGKDTLPATVTAAGVGSATVVPGWVSPVAAAGRGTATVTATTTPRPTPAVTPPVIASTTARASYALWYTVDAYFNGSPVAGAQGLLPIGGTITDTIKPGVRRTLQLDLPPTPGLYDLLTPYGTLLNVTAHVRDQGRATTDIPMGVFRVDSESVRVGNGKLSITAPDKWAGIVQAKFMWPTGPQVGLLVTDQIARLIRDALGSKETVNVTATSKLTVGALSWQQDRAQAIIDLAKSIGAWVYFDDLGVATIADIPTIGASADWLIDASASGVLIGLDRQRSRANTYNVVAVSSSAAGGAAFPTQYVWDSDPNSPTYAGTNPQFATNVGPFGIAVYFHDDPTAQSAGDATNIGRAILAQTVGLASTASITSVPNPSVRAFQTMDVLPPQERYDVARVLERHVVDTVTHPLDVTQPQTIAGRSTRTDPYT